jgi:hypothetical protein
MNNTWTEGQTIGSIKKQKKALYFATPIIAIISVINITSTNRLIEREIQRMIELGHINSNYTQMNLMKFCNYTDDIDVNFYVNVCYDMW